MALHVFLIALLFPALAAPAAAVVLDEASLAQNLVIRAPPSAHPGKCLNFIHIPRTGGTTIDGLNLNLSRGERAFHSFMEAALDKAAGGPRWPKLSPGQLFQRSHGGEFTDEGSSSAAEIYGRKYLPYLGFRYIKWKCPFGGFSQRCQDLHTPPQYDSAIRQRFEQEGCTNFCVVRDPMSRLLSAYKFRGFGSCSLAAFEHWVLATFPLRHQITYCHAYPQVEYVFDAPSRAKATKQWCHRMVRFEHLARDFNAVMEEFDKPLRMGNTSLFGSGACHIDASGLSRKAKDRVYDYYRADYEAFGYARPE